MTELGHLTTLEAGVALQSARIAILPVGAQEQHGPHLETRTDSAIALRFAERLAAALGEQALLCPLVPYGLSDHHMAFAGTVTLRPSTFRGIILDIAESLREHGIDKIVVVNGHGGNIDAIRLAAREALRDTGTRIAHLMWAQLASEEISEFAGRDGMRNHACQVETSLAMVLEPSLIRRDQVADTMTARTPHPLTDPPFAVVDLPVRFETLTTDGALGHPTKADEQAGRVIVDAALSRAIEFCKEFISG